MKIREACVADAAAIADIYNHYVTETIVTFEEAIVSVDEMASRIREVQDVGLPWFVILEQDEIAGFSFAGPFRKRAAYRYAVETTVYVNSSRTGQGMGRRLYASLLAELRSKELRVAIGCITLPNEASVKLHESLGFVKTGHFKEIGFKFGCWLDVGYWQLQLDLAQLPQ